jgi:hypothetical protein
MGLRIDWRYLDGAAFEDLTEYFEKFELAVTMNAEEGSTGNSTITLYDPVAELDIVGLSHFRVREMDAPTGEQYIGQYYAADSKVRRGESELVTVQRVWDVNLVDINEVLARRVFSKDEADRPAESDVARLQWLLTTAQMGLVDDSTYFDATGSVPMDAVDYRGQTPHSILDDCAQQSGKNWYLWFNEAASGTGFSLWYAHAVSSNYSSAISLSNVLADVDYSTVFALSADTELKRDPSRVYGGVYLPYDGGAVHVRSTATLIDYPLRDFVAPSFNVKTAAKANARARRYLADLDTEEDVITTTVVVPRAQVNDLMQGMRVQVKASHLPGYSAYVWMRCLNRTVKELNEDEYAITVELGAPKSPHLSDAQGVLYMTKGPFSGNVYFAQPGDTPPPGWLPITTMSGLTAVTDPAAPNPGWSYVGWDVTGTGSLDLRLSASIAGVLVDNIPLTFTLAITLNGSVVASEQLVLTGSLVYFGPMMPDVTITGLALVPGDEIRARLTVSPSMGFITPSGTGQSNEGFYVTGGSLA